MNTKRRTKIMEPKVKFGNIIYNSVFGKLLAIGKQLASIGFKESKSKPNLGSSYFLVGKQSNNNEKASDNRGFCIKHMKFLY